MKTVEGVAELRRARSELGPRVGFVPTMGALHRGHQSLMEAARAECDHLVVSVFVNPTQFGPGEDFEAYPRPLEADQALCQESGVDLLWLPQVEDLYPAGAQTTVQVEPLGSLWEGASRPGHFQGVATVVTKLLMAVGPTATYFGEKDLQQLQVIRQMVRDLLIPVEVRGVPIARDERGLALSSRNQYLNSEQREQASQLYRSLEQARLARSGGAAAVQQAFRDNLAQLPGAEVECLDLIAEDFTRGPEGEESVEGAYLCVAVRYCGVRLIDQIKLCS